GRLRTRHAMAGSQLVDDAALRARSLGAQLLHADSPRPVVLSPRAGRPSRAGNELIQAAAQVGASWPSAAGSRFLTGPETAGFNRTRSWPVQLRILCKVEAAAALELTLDDRGFRVRS